MKIQPVVNKRPLEIINEKMEDLEYWLSQPARDRIASVTFLIAQSLEPGQRIDKTKVVRRKLKA